MRTPPRAVVENRGIIQPINKSPESLAGAILAALLGLVAVVAWSLVALMLVNL